MGAQSSKRARLTTKLLNFVNLVHLVPLRFLLKRSTTTSIKISPRIGLFISRNRASSSRYSRSRARNSSSSYNNSDKCSSISKNSSSKNSSSKNSSSSQVPS